MLTEVYIRDRRTKHRGRWSHCLALASGFMILPPIEPAQREELARGAASGTASILLRSPALITVLLFLAIALISTRAVGQSNDDLFDDSHFHLTNYIQEGTDIHDFLTIMGNKVGRVA